MDENSTLKGLGANAGVALFTQQATADKARSLEKQDVTDTKQKEKALKGFEALLLQEMFKSMWETVDTTGLLGENGNEAQIYRGMLNQAIADTTAEGKGIGIKKVLLKELNKRERHQNEGDAAPLSGRIPQSFALKRPIDAEG